MRVSRFVILLATLALGLGGRAQSLPGTTALTATGDLSAQMVEGIERWLGRETARLATNRHAFWQRDYSSAAAYERSVAPNRERLRRLIGAVNERVPEPGFRIVADYPAASGPVRAGHYTITTVQWPVLPGVTGEGLLLEPDGASNGSPRVVVIALPDADQTPEMAAGLEVSSKPDSQFARRLVESGFTVLVPALISRSDEFSGNAKLKRFTNQPHREWIYRQAYEMGRHIIGYEVEKILAASDAAEATWGRGAPHGLKLALFGYGEGGLLALHAAALDTRIAATVVSGYFDVRDQLWSEPIYRNLFGLLREFGDAEIASLIAPRSLIVEFSAGPLVNGPPSARSGRSGAAPGKILPAEFVSVENEVERARELTRKLPGRSFIEFVYGSEGAVVEPGSRTTLRLLATTLGQKLQPDSSLMALPVAPAVPALRQQRQVAELQEFTQRLFRESERVRDGIISKTWRDTNALLAAALTNRERFAVEVMGRIDSRRLPANPRSRAWRETARWAGHEVTLEVQPDLFAWGLLLVPKDLKPGEKRPVVVCQHGLEGLPEDTVTEDAKAGGFQYYRAFAARLADQGYIVFAPHNPYRGQDKFRVLQRKANPLGLSLFSFIIAQHEVITDWLAGLDFVDPTRIAFYGLSYGGKTAMRVPAVVPRYCLSICSADFNEWVQKCVTTDSPYSYLFTGEYEMPEWNLGHTFNYAEMASLIAPRPFMVERGHDDGVAPDTWVAYEFAKVRRMYDRLGLAERAELEIFDGPHTIHGVGTFRFLQQHLGWPGR